MFAVRCLPWAWIILASALIEHPLFGMAWFCIPYMYVAHFMIILDHVGGGLNGHSLLATAAYENV